jgi:hypothetical protein
VDTDELMKRFDERNADNIEQERADRRENRLVMFNQQDLIQRAFNSAALRTAEFFNLEPAHVSTTVEINHAEKRFEPRIVIHKGDVDLERAQERFLIEYRGVLDECKAQRDEINACARDFPRPEPESLDSFVERLKAWYAR